MDQLILPVGCSVVAEPLFKHEWLSNLKAMIRFRAGLLLRYLLEPCSNSGYTTGRHIPLLFCYSYNSILQN